MSEATSPPVEAEVWVERPGRLYNPGDVLQGHYRIEGLGEGDASIELSVLWYTMGQGEEDFGVAFFERRPANEGNLCGDFSAVLPPCPFSYDGQVVKVCWAARMRCLLPGGKQRLVEAPFWLVPRLGAT